MFILPISQKLDWRHIPWITVLLVLVNAFVFFALQAADQAVYREANDYYQKSVLARLEIPAYAEYLRAHRKEWEAQEFERELEHAPPIRALGFMERDAMFSILLQSDRIIRPDHPEFAQWRTQRAELNRILVRRFTDKYAFVPAKAEPLTYLTCMFLHGDENHLVGNMMVLAVVGFMVEMALGGAWFLLFYLVSGAASAAFSGFMHGGSTIMELGASGAISGAMAMYTVMYGLRRIRFFYFVIFYFDTMEAPAIALLPMFILNEVYQQIIHSHGHVNYMAHLGGLLAGATLCGAYRLMVKPAPIAIRLSGAQEADAQSRHEKGAASDFEQAHHEAKMLVGNLELPRARHAFSQLLEQRPDDRALLMEYYHLARIAPDSQEYRDAACRVMGLKDKDEESLRLVRRTLLEYLDLAPPKADIPLRPLPNLAIWLARTGHEFKSHRLARQLLDRQPDHPHLAPVMMEVAKALGRKGEKRDADMWLREILQRRPDSKEAQVASLLLRG